MNYDRACEILGISIKNTDEMIREEGKKAFTLLFIEDGGIQRWVYR